MAASSPSPSERRGIPGASFVGDVQTYLTESGLDVNSSLAFLQERLQQYKIVEMKLLAQQRDLQAKIPDIEKCLDVVATLQGKKGTGESRAKRINWDPQCRAGDLPERFMAAARSCRMGDLLHTPLPNTVCHCVCLYALVADFEVSEGIYSQTRIEGTDSVSLWLGANVMLEYSLEEAETLLRKNLENAKASLEVLVADLQFLRDQVTITQVTTARVYNWDVHQRRSIQAA